MTITAQEAAAITEQNIKTVVIQPIVEALEKEIKRKAKEGKRSFDPVRFLSTQRSCRPSFEEMKAVQWHFTQQGFKWRNHADPDPGDPRGGAYTILSW